MSVPEAEHLQSSLADVFSSTGETFTVVILQG